MHPFLLHSSQNGVWNCYVKPVPSVQIFSSSQSPFEPSLQNKLQPLGRQNAPRYFTNVPPCPLALPHPQPNLPPADHVNGSYHRGLRALHTPEPITRGHTLLQGGPSPLGARSTHQSHFPKLRHQTSRPMSKRKSFFPQW